MTYTQIVILYLMLVGGLVSGCRQSNRQSPPCTMTPSISGCEVLRVVQEIESLVSKFSHDAVPSHFRSDNPRRDGSEFDPMQFFNVLKHLRVRDGFVIDYVYAFRGTYGEPYVFLRAVDEKRLLTVDEYLSRYDRSEERRRILENVIADGSKESFFELVLFCEYMEHFYLYWHAACAKRLIVDARQMDAVLHEFWASTVAECTVGSEGTDGLAGLDLAPTVLIRGGEAIVRVVVFSEGLGIQQVTYIFSPSHSGVRVKREVKIVMRHEAVIP